MAPRSRRVDEMLDAGYARLNEDEWRHNLDPSPHGMLWHTSFHASSFPGDEARACGRLAMYGLMDIPAPAPFDRRGRTIMDAGEDLEVRQVTALEMTGKLISEPPWSRTQTGFVVPELWLTGNVDAVVVTPLATPHPVEFKGKDDDAVQKMWRGEQSFDDAHRRQLLTYIGLARDHGREMWPLLGPATDGTLIYVSRNRPYNTMEYVFEYDRGFMEAGYDRLRTWQQSFVDGRLPQRDRSWRWTEPPCRWCPLKKICKEDVRGGVTRLEDSRAVAFAKKLRPTYDYESARAQVFSRWYNAKETNARVA